MPTPCRPNFGSPTTSPPPEMRHNLETEPTYSPDQETGSGTYGAIYPLRIGSNLLTPDGAKG